MKIQGLSFKGNEKPFVPMNMKASDLNNIKPNNSVIVSYDGFTSSSNQTSNTFNNDSSPTKIAGTIAAGLGLVGLGFLAQKNKALETQVNELRKSLNPLKYQIKDIPQRMVSVEERVRQLPKRISSVEQQLIDMPGKLQSKVTALSKQMEEFYQPRLEEFAEKLSGLTRAKDKLREGLQINTHEIRQTQNVVTSLAEQIKK